MLKRPGVEKGRHVHSPHKFHKEMLAYKLEMDKVCEGVSDLDHEWAGGGRKEALNQDILNENNDL